MPGTETLPLRPVPALALLVFWSISSLLIFSVAFAVTTGLTFYTLAKSKRLSDFIDATSDERLTLWQKVGALGAVWRRGGE